MTFGDSVKDEEDNVDNGNIFITNAIKSSKNINEGKKDNDEVEKEIKKLNDPQPISFLKLYRYATLKDKIMIAIGCFGALVTGLLSPANTLIFGRLTDAMVKQASTLFNPALTEIKYAATLINENNITSRSDAITNTDEMKDWFLNEVKMFAIYNSIIGALMFIFTYLSITLFNYAAHNQIFNIRSAFLKSALSQDMGWYDLTQSGEFSSRMNEDLSKLEEGLGEKIAMFLHFMVGFVGSMVLAFALGWQLALVCLASLPVTMISLGLVGMITSKLAKKESEAYAKAGTIAEEVFSAIRTVFAFSGQEKESKRYCENLVDAKKINIRKGFFSGFGFGLLWFFIYAAYALAFWYGIGLVLDQRDWSDDDRIYSPGVMFTVFFSVMVGSMNLGIASPFIEIFGVAKGAGAKVYSVIEQKPKIDTITDEGLIPDTAASDITFQNVNFEYPSRPEVKVLQELNFTINRGDTVALVGSSGCGKSTTIQLIQRFYDTTGGLVKLGGIDIKTMNVNWLRSRIGVVGQEPVLFGTTISENIRYGNEKATKEEIESAAKAANAHNFIKKLPNGYETLVGERGAQMSGGQKQRIAIARALVRNPEILLLDEATSALDTASEAKVQAALEKASEGRTTVIVAHRLTTIRNADKIFVFHNGKIIEQGNHKELMLLGKHYHGLVTTQVGSMEERDKPTVEKQISIRPVIDEDEKEFAVAKEEADEYLLNAPKTMSVYKIMEWNKTEWPFILLGSITSVVMGSAMPLFSLLFGKILNVLAFDDADDVRSEANIYSLYFVITGIVVGIATFLQIYTYGIAGEILTERVRGMTFSTMLKQEIGWFDDKSNGTGTLCARLSGEAAAVQGATGQRIGTVLQSISTLGLSIGLAFYYEWRLAFVALAFTPFLLIASYLEIRVMEQENLGNAKAMEKSTKLAVEVISNIRTVISLGREKMFHRKYMDLLEPSVKRAKKTTHYRGIVYGIARSLMYFVYSICMLYGGYLVVNDNVQYGDVFIVTQALIMGSVSIANAIAFAPNFHKGLLAASKINQILTRTPKIRDPQNIDQPDRKWDAYGNVIYYETDFYYPSRPSALVLNCLNMNIMQGQTVALVGSSGCGKSTCIQLLERFYDTTSGYVAIDNKDVESVTLKNLRSQLGIVSQEPSLFDRTIAENIAYGDNSREVSSDEIILAAKNANIHTFITSLPLGYETRLGDKGTQLSGGQKQRVAIARALVRNPRILLLDEATSALDSESEKIVQDALDLAKEGRTCITIAHRLTTIIDSDVIIVIDGGKSVESGTHKELMALRGIYYGLFTLQSGSL